jgi:hypothetical protein
MKAAAIVTAAMVCASLIDAACADSRASELAAHSPARAAVSQQLSGDTGSVRELIEGVRGANAIQCELLLQPFSGWSTTIPDRDVNAWRITQRARYRVTEPADIAWLGEQIRGADVCAARASVRLLGRSPAAAARALLVQALSDANAQVRRLAAVGIGIRGDSTVNRRLVAMLADGDAGVRAAAAWALGAVH